MRSTRTWWRGKRACAAIAGATAAVGAAALAVDTAAAADCGDLAGKQYGDATIMAATTVLPPSSLMGLDPPAPVAINTPFCRVEGLIKTSESSQDHFEVWLPEKSAWNGKYQGVGNGGFAGSLILSPMTWALQAGYAVSATDTGHTGGTLYAAWALGHPRKIVDFGWRAIHETAQASKAIIADYYRKPPAHAYFSGCSDGGREALMEAQRFPKDYEGIVAGAPANSWTKLLTTGVSVEQALDQPSAWLSPAKLAIISKAVFAQCPAESGYVEDPAQCRFDPASLVCKAGQTEGCLTEPEAAALKRIYSGLNDASGKTIFPGYSPGGEAGPAAWALWITGDEAHHTAGSLINGFATGYFAHMVFDKPDWRIDGQNVSDDLAAAEKKTGEALDSSDPDLSAFRAAGGKLIQYHGWNDAGIPPQSSVDYYEQSASKMGGLDNIRSFYRLFMAPGMDHCGGGPGPSAIGGVFGLPSVSRDPGHDVVAALAHWVEDGVAPNQIVAARYRDNDPAKGVDAQRPWCAYPATARYSGQGDRSAAASYACAAPSK
jgi:Tannase and feruloyl esterase